MFQPEGSVVVDREICNLVNAYCHSDSGLSLSSSNLVQIGTESSILPSFLLRFSSRFGSFSVPPSRIRLLIIALGDDLYRLPLEVVFPKNGLERRAVSTKRQYLTGCHKHH